MFSLFSKKAIGLSISDRTIEIVKLARDGPSFKITATGRGIFPTGVVKNGRIKDAKALTQIFKKAAAGAAPKPISPGPVRMCLPENQVFSLVFDLTAAAKRAPAKAPVELVKDKIKQTIPVAFDDLFFKTKTFKREPAVVAAAVAASRPILADWRDWLNQSGFVLKSFETELLAAASALYPKGPAESVAIIDFGAKITEIGIFDEIGLHYVKTINQGGDDLTELIASDLKIAPAAAETKKQAIGLADADDPVFQLIIKGLEPIRNGIKTALDYYEETDGRPIGQFILIGGGALIEGLADYLATNLGRPAVIGYWDEKFFATTFKTNQQLIYLSATSAALIELYPNLPAAKFSLLPDD